MVTPEPMTCHGRPPSRDPILVKVNRRLVSEAINGMVSNVHFLSQHFTICEGIGTVFFLALMKSRALVKKGKTLKYCSRGVEDLWHALSSLPSARLLVFPFSTS